ncbi:UNVERIFIED_CONTAM: Wall-associated receptor kinase [Sesamum radiatum]|uniref:Wall-associated receptor kinase n=1 Tax=Sesamum radiatum TaxID=300843 RepID=A0AAW2NNE5_SESRA
MLTNILLYSFFFHLVWLQLRGAASDPATITNVNITKPGCQSSKAFSMGNLEVIDISDSQMRIKNWVAASCYNQQGNLTFRRMYEIQLSTSFSLSDMNKLMWNWLLPDPIPRPRRLFISVASLKNWPFDPCGYSFLGDLESLKFHSSDLTDPTFLNRTTDNVPIILDWAIGNQTCVELLKSNSSACHKNSKCIDSDTGLGGYRCVCDDGNEGNPYLEPGCTDINECDNGPCDPQGYVLILQVVIPVRVHMDSLAMARKVVAATLCLHSFQS